MKKVKQHILAANHFFNNSSSINHSNGFNYGIIYRQFSNINNNIDKSSDCIIEKYSLFGREIFIAKDVIRNEEFAKYVSGNKWRKLQFLINPRHDQLLTPNIREIRSYGSLQSNAMLSMAYLCFLNGWKFKYHVDRSLEYIENQVNIRQIGNLFETVKLKERGLDLQFIDSRACYEQVKEDFTKRCLSGEAIKSDGILYVREGVAQKEAEYGYALLAREIVDKMTCSNNVNVFLPSGTGTSALFLSKHLTKLSPNKFTVYTTNCVGDEEYLTKQFLELESDTGMHPKIIRTLKNYRYGQLYPEIYKIIEEVKQQTSIQFDYLYDGKGFLTIQEQLVSSDEPLVYIHSGGLIGNETMKERYQNSVKQ